MPISRQLDLYPYKSTWEFKTGALPWFLIQAKHAWEWNISVPKATGCGQCPILNCSIWPVSELVSLGLAKAEDVEDGVVIRQAKATQCTTTSTVSILR